jgi:hypothetical protein
MKAGMWCLSLAVTLNAQAIPENSTGAKLRSILERIARKPTALVIAVKGDSSEALESIRQMGPALGPLVRDGRGEIAVLSYGDRIRIVQPFTSDSAAVSNAIGGLKISGTSSPMIDAVAEGISALEARPMYRRRILLVLGEGKDHPVSRAGESILDRAQRSSVLIYVITAAQ